MRNQVLFVLGLLLFSTNSIALAPPTLPIQPQNMISLQICDFTVNPQGEFVLTFLNNNRPIYIHSINVINSLNQKCIINVSTQRILRAGEIFELKSSQCIAYYDKPGIDTTDYFTVNLTYDQLSVKKEIIEANITASTVFRFYPLRAMEKPSEDGTPEIVIGVLAILLIILLLLGIGYKRSKGLPKGSETSN